MRQEEHREEVLALWKENMSDSRMAEIAEPRFDWYYRRNPQGGPTTNLLLDCSSNRVVGCGSFFPRRIVLDGKPLWMGIMADFAVASAHRAAGPAIAIQRSLADAGRAAGMNFLAAYPNRASEPIFKRIGYQAVGKSARWVKPLRSRKEMSRRFSDSVLAGAAGGVVDAGLAALDLGRIARLPGRVKKMRGIYLDSSDDRFDALWERARMAQRLTGERSSSYLNWRYRDFLSLKYRFFGLVDESGTSLFAYLTFFVNANRASVVGDLFSGDFETTLDALLLRFSAAERKAGRESVSLDYLGPDPFGEKLNRLGFHRRATARSLFVYFDPATPQELQRLVLDKSNWFTLDAEMDI